MVVLEPLTWNDKPRCQHIITFGRELQYQCSKLALSSGLCYQHDPEMSEAYRRKRSAVAEKRKRLLSIRRQDAQDFKDSALRYDDVVTLIGWWKLGGQAAFDEWGGENAMQHVQQPTTPVLLDRTTTM